MKKALLGTTAIVGTSLLMAGPAAAKPELTIGGALDFQVGWTSQDREGWSPTPGGTTGPATERGFSMFQKTFLYFKATDKTDSGMTWAFRVDLNADSDGGPGGSAGQSSSGRDNADKTTLTLSDAWGSMMVGADYGPAHTWFFGAKSAVKDAGTGGVDGNWARWFNRTSVTTRFESSTSVRDSTTSSKIMYATPRVAGFAGAVSYAPDRTTIGRFREPDATSGLEQNFWEAAVNYVNKFGDFDVGLSATYDHADSRGSTPTGSAGVSGKDTSVWSLGATAGYGSWKVGGRYAQKAGVEGDLDTFTNTGYDQWDLGVGYTTGPWSLGLSFLRQEAGHVNSTGTDSNDVWAFGTTYDMGGGLQLYGDLFHADVSAAASSQANSENTATGLITGVRVKF